MNGLSSLFASDRPRLSRQRTERGNKTMSNDKNMSERKYKVGDAVRTLVDTDMIGNKLFPKGTIGTITKVIKLGNINIFQYKVEADENWWYYEDGMIEPVDDGETPKQDPCYDTISRQAVLDYIYNDLGLGDEKNGKDVERQMELERSYKYVKSLPPVAPKTCNDAISRQAVLEYIEGSEAELGHSSENELVCQDIKELPPVTPMQKSCDDVLDKIKAEIENTEIVGHIRDVECFNAGINVALNVINKYMTESEE